MAEIHCPLCGGKNWIPDGAELKCFFCGNPLPPEPDLSQNVQYAPLPEPGPLKQPEADDLPFVKQILVVPVPDSSAETDAPAEMGAEAQFSRAEQKPNAPVHYRMTEMLDLPPEEVRSPEKKARARLEQSHWCFMNIAFSCMQSFLFWVIEYFLHLGMDSTDLLPLSISLFVSVFALPIVSFVFCPEEILNEKNDDRESEHSSESLVITLFFAFCFGMMPGGILGKEWPELGFIAGSVLAIAASAVIALVNYAIYAIIPDDRK